MLLELHIKDYALVDEAVLEFGPGFNVLTGETGAGKSLIIGAVTLLLGGRGATEQIRTGCSEASVHGVFSVSKEGALAKHLSGLGIDLGDDNTLIISCTISASGRSQRRVNGSPVTQAMLAEIGEYLVDIHGQHEHQSLLKQKSHIGYLDNFSGDEGLGLKQQVNAYYRRLNRLQASYRELRLSEQERERRLDLLRYQSDEIDSARLVAGEDVALAKEQHVLASASELHDRASRAYSLLHGEDHASSGISPGVMDSIAAALEELEAILSIDNSPSDSKELLETALAACDEAARRIRRSRDGIDSDPARLAEIESRLFAIQRLKRKYGDTVDEILEYRAEIGEEIRRLESSSEELAAIEKEIAKVRQDLGKASEALRNVRMRAAKVLSERVSSELQELAMGSALFNVDFRDAEDPDGVPVGGKTLAVTASGVDIVEFLLSANPGEPPKPLARIASGGEISRVMLALKTILASADEVNTLIFDEIDAGIGGRTGTVIGEKLAAIGKVRQVICVTHLPQIACMADIHYSIGKDVKDGRAYTVVTRLRDSDRVREIARMLGGHPELTATSIKHAKEMLKIG